MKKYTIAMLAVVAISAAALVARAEEVKTAAPAQPTQKTAAEQAHETCAKKGLAGALLDECVKTEEAKLAKTEKTK